MGYSLTLNIKYEYCVIQTGNNKTCLGYLIDNDVPDGLIQDVVPDSQAPNTSLAQLVRVSGQSLDALLRGPESIGGLIESSSRFQVIPSPNNPISLAGFYYHGGINLHKYVTIN